MRDRKTIDAELRLLAAVRWSIREHGGELRPGISTNCSTSTEAIDRLDPCRLAAEVAAADPAILP